jgi:hypothetical protein
VLSRLALLACLVLALAPRGALALPSLALCEEGHADDARADDVRGGELDVEEAAAPTVILPCSLADAGAGAWGAACADASFYVVNPAGVLLCQIELPALSTSGLPQVERTPATPAPGSSSTFFAAGLPAPLVRLPAPLVVDLPPPPTAPPGAARDGHGKLSVPPS